jgi:hypothetical protein
MKRANASMRARTAFGQLKSRFQRNASAGASWAGFSKDRIAGQRPPWKKAAMAISPAKSSAMRTAALPPMQEPAMATFPVATPAVPAHAKNAVIFNAWQGAPETDGYNNERLSKNITDHIY